MKIICALFCLAALGGVAVLALGVMLGLYGAFETVVVGGLTVTMMGLGLWGLGES